METLRQDMDSMITPPVWVPLAAGPNVVRDFFWLAVRIAVAAPWSAGAVLPPFPCEAMLRMPLVGSHASDQQSASMAGALQEVASGARVLCRNSVNLFRTDWAGPPVQPENTGSLLPVAPENPDLGVFFL